MNIFRQDKEKTSRDLFELVYAIVRIGESISGNKFGSIITDVALDLFASDSGNSREGRLMYSDSLRQLFSLGIGTGFIRMEEGEYVLDKLNKLINCWKSVEVSDGKTNPNNFKPSEELLVMAGLSGESVSVISTKAEETSKAVSNREVAISGSEVEQAFPEREESNYSKTVSDYIPESSDVSGEQYISGEARQLAIFNHIRKSGNCRIRDIQNLFPDINERTIRYHLQKLSEKGLIEQMGAAAATYYKLKDVFRQNFRSEVS